MFRYVDVSRAPTASPGAAASAAAAAARVSEVLLDWEEAAACGLDNAHAASNGLGGALPAGAGTLKD